MKNNEKPMPECPLSNLYQIKLKEKYKNIFLSNDFPGIIHETLFDLISQNLTSDFHKENISNSEYIRVSSHILILRRLFIEDQEYPDFLLNLLEIQCMKDIVSQHKLLIEGSDSEMFHEKFSLQMVGYYFRPLDTKIQILDILYFTHANDENFLILSSEQNFLKKTPEKKKNDENFHKIASKIVNFKANYFESLDSYYTGFHIFKNKISNETSCLFSLDRFFQEKNLRQIYLKPLYFIRKKLEEKEIPTRELVWFLCFLGKRYHQLREVRQSLKIFDETYNLRAIEWGENSTESMDSLNRIGCALLRRKNKINKNAKEIFDRVHVIRKTLLGETNNLNAISLYNLGIASLSSSNYEEACAYFHSAILIYAALKKSYEIKQADCLQALGTTLLKLKKYDESIRKLKDSQKISSIRIEEPYFSLKYAQISNTLALVYDQKKEPVNCYRCLLKTFLIFNALKGERNEVIDYRNRILKVREENKKFNLIEVGYLLKRKLLPIFKRNVIIEDILVCFIGKN